MIASLCISYICVIIKSIEAVYYFIKMVIVFVDKYIETVYNVAAREENHAE